MIKLTKSQELEICSLYIDGLTMEQCGAKFKIIFSRVQWILKKHNIKSRARGIPIKRGHFNDDIFDKINTEEKAYWLGFILGDGSVNKYRLQIQLASKDKEHLYKFQKFLKSNHKISKIKSRDSYSICIGSKYLMASLKKHGIIQNKTYKDVRTPKTIPKNLLPHFYRGILDADGWILRCKKRKKNWVSQYKFGFCSNNINFINEIHQWICNSIKQNCGYISFKDKDKNMGANKVEFSGNNIYINIYKLLYKTAKIYLDRKFKAGTIYYKNILIMDGLPINNYRIKVIRNDGKIFPSMIEAGRALKLHSPHLVTRHIKHQVPRAIKGFTFKVYNK